VFAGGLETLDVSHVYQLTDACVPPLVRGCHSLQTLTAVKCLRLGDHSWALLQPSLQPTQSQLAAACPVRVLDLSACKVSDHGLRRLGEAWRRALHGHLSSDAQGIGEFSLSSSTKSITSFSLSTSCPVLTSLSLAECQAIGDDGLAAILPVLPLLESLSLAGCHRLSDRGVACIVNHCRSLTSLQLHQCVEMSDTVVHDLAVSLPRLRDIGLDEVLSLTNASLDVLASNCPELRRVSLRQTAMTHPALLHLITACVHLTHLNCALAPHVTALAVTHPDVRWQQLLRIVARRGIVFLR
jgi:hypothetical protein